MPVSDPDVSRPRLIRDATFLEADRREIALRRGPHNRLGFAYQVAFVRVLGRFPQQAPLEIDGEILRFAALQLGADAETIHAYERRQQTVSEHQQRIGEYLRLRTFDTAVGERLARFLEDEALRLDRTASLLGRARGWLRDEHVLAPADSVLRRVVGAARHKARALLTQRMAERLSAPMRDRLDELVAVGDDQPHSPLHGIPSVGGVKRLLARLESIEATGVLDINVSWVNGNYQRILFHSVRGPRPPTGCARWRPRVATSRWCASCTKRGATRSTRPSTCTASSSTGIGSWSKNASTTCSRRNATPSTGSFSATGGLAPCCSIPPSATTSCAPDCCPSCRRRSCARTSPTWRAGRGATERPASSRRPSVTPG